MSATSISPASTRDRRELRLLLAAWLVIAIAWLWLGFSPASTLGLNYDEAIFAGMAKDFTMGTQQGHHMPGNGVVMLWDRPFPVWIQPYLGAVKSWQLIPLFTFFEPTVAMARMSNLAWTLLGLLLFMLWVRKLFGLSEALLGAALLATDPGVFYLGLLDWGSFVPSFVCRLAGFLLVLMAWRSRKLAPAFFAGAVLGLGFFNKVDFVVVLLGVTGAAVVAYAGPVLNFVRTRPKLVALGLLGFLFGSGPMTAMSLRMFKFAAANNAPVNPGELAEKWHAFTAMYDGSYFYRLMDVGGLFDKMPSVAPPVWSPLLPLLVVAVVILAAQAYRLTAGSDARRMRVFLLLALFATTIGVFLLPRAIRIYHAILAAPFAHLIIAFVAVDLWRKGSEKTALRKPVQTLIAAALAALIALQCLALAKTTQLITATHGRGWWSDAQDRFAATIKQRPDVTLVSLDWGFHESLLFLTDKPLLIEPFWRLYGTDPAQLPQPTNFVFLAHPPEYSLSPYGATFMEYARTNARAKIGEWRDHEGKLVFYTVQFGAP